MADQEAAQAADRARRQEASNRVSTMVREQQEKAAAARREAADLMAAAQAARTQQVKNEAELQAIGEHFKTWAGGSGWADGATDADLGNAVDSARKDLARATELRASLGKEAIPQDKVEGILAGLGAVVAAEQKCRADVKCMSARAARKAEAEFFGSVVAPMCEADQNREQATAAMAHERANPSGYVNKVVLHDAGETIQTAQETLQQYASAYAKVRHHGWPGWRKECPAP